MALAALKGAWPSRPELKLILSGVVGYTLLVDFVAIDLTDDEIAWNAYRDGQRSAAPGPRQTKLHSEGLPT